VDARLPDPVGTGLAALVGVAVGIVLAIPMVPWLSAPAETLLPGDAVSPVVVTAVLGVPVGLFVLYGVVVSLR
jgi:hypothetical protein